MVQIGVQVVDADSVDAHDLHECRIAQASVGMAEGILSCFGIVSCAATGLIRDTGNLKHIAVIIDKVGALDLERLDSSHDRGEESHEGRLDLETGGDASSANEAIH